MGDWKDGRLAEPEEELLARIRQHTETGRPPGSEAFLRQLEAQTSLILLPQKRGPKPKRPGKEGIDE